MLRANPDRMMYRYEIVDAVRHIRTDKQAYRAVQPRKEP
jgi:hypothetical protein